MKTFKKIFLGLALLTASLALFSVVNPHKGYALAATDFNSATYTYDPASNSILVKVGGQLITFNNSGTGFATTFVPVPVTFPDNSGKFCSGSQITYSPPATSGTINVQWVNNLTSNCISLSPKYTNNNITIGTTTAPGGTTTGSSTSTCESNFVSPFAWIVCPVLDFADKAIGAAYGQVENQLCFNTGTTSSTGGIVCNGPNSLVDGVKSAWSIFKNIASALLVIVMLVMVISQAVGGGPFDAYTVRKMLPKLVAAVIIMQLSFLLLRYAIDLSNDAGSAIGRLMMAPFGGPDNLNLADMIGNGVHVATGSTGGQVAFDLFATIAAIGAFVYAIPALPLLALYVLTGVFIAFFVLVLRKLLIIMLVILAPIAFVAWILPGTERYWKLWSDNMLKLLAMFPLIMAMLSAGRIFAYITSKSGNGASMFNPQLALAHIGPVPVPYFASATGFADLAIIIGAFFAPYFLLPKTFSWGGQLLGAAGKKVEEYTSKGTEPAKGFLKKREESYRAERGRKSRERFASGEKFNWKRIPSYWQRPVDLARAGKIDPTLGLPRMTIKGKTISEGSRRRQEAMDRFVAEGEESEEKARKAAEARIVRDRQRIRAQGGNHDLYLQAIADGLEYYEDPSLGKVDVSQHSRSEVGRNAARAQLAKLGAGMNWRYLEDYYESTTRELKEAQASGDAGRIRHAEAESREMRKFFDDNVETILPKLPHIYKSVTQAADADPNGIASMHGVEIEAILANLSDTIQRGSAPGATAEQVRSAQAAQGSLTTFLQNFQRSVENSQRGGPQLENGALRAVKAFLTRDDHVAADLLQDINLGGDPALGRDVHGRQPTHRQDALPGSHPRSLLELGRSQDLHLDAVHTTEVDHLRDSLGGLIDEAGYVRAQAPPPTAPTVGTLRVEHQQQAAQAIPNEVALTTSPPVREALKIQLRTNPNIAQTFVNNIAFGGANEQAYREVLAEMRNDAVTAGTPEAKEEYNNLVSQVQQALQQRIVSTASVAAQRGHDVTGAWTAGSERIIALEPTGPAPPAGAPDIRKLP